MNNQEYEQKKHECWEEFCIKNPAFNDMLGRKIFNQIFDRAYALGKEKETITQEDIERAAEKYADELKVSSTIPAVIVPMLHDIAKSSYICGAQDALGKLEKDTEDGSLWSRLTDEEKRTMQCRYHTNECVLRDHKKRTGDKAQSKAVARMKLLENLFGKENIKTHNNG